MNTHTSKDFNEADFAWKIRQALNENLESLPTDAQDRLAKARKLAMARKKAGAPVFVQAFATQLAGAGASFGQSSNFAPRSWLNRFGMILPVLALVIGLVGIYRYEEQQRINETADIDALVLSDELPLSAYLDHGFSAFLNKHGE